MIWPGDHKWPGRVKVVLHPRVILAELLCGLDSGLPFCCVFYYLIAARFYIVLRNIQIMNVLFPDGWEFFRKNNYHRCIVCKALDKKPAKVKWNNKSDGYWERKLGGFK